MTTIRIAVHGAAGRMGRRIVALAAEQTDCTVAAALEHSQHPRLGEDAGVLAGVAPLGIQLSASLEESVDCLIDFSLPEASLAIGQCCALRGVPLVVATTGFDASQRDTLADLAGRIPLLTSPNMSLAVNLLMKLSAVAATALKDHPDGVDVEIVECHHRYKEDAPSGTALKFGQIIAQRMGLSKHVHGRSGRPGARSPDEIGYHALRSGDHPGEHTISFGMLGESIELAVRATGRDGYARGALAAARYIAGKPPGNYNMEDVLGL